MKIFPAQSSAPSRVSNSEKSSAKEGGGKITRKKAEAPPKKEMSPEAIKEKLAANVGVSEAAKEAAIKNSKKLSDGFMDEKVAFAKKKVEVVEVEAPKIEANQTDEIKTPNTKDLTLKSDVALNDPKDTNTQEKLKTVLSKGAFSFNPKEREALEKILG